MKKETSCLSPGFPEQNPKLRAAVESHPNVEKHDVRMGHPASRSVLVDGHTSELASSEIIVASGGLSVCDGAHWLGVMKNP
jgi:hypothetical protein